jgi:outer membrane protein assembly factor BamB
MLTRLPLVLAPLFAAACADDLGDPTILPPVGARSTVTEPGPRTHPDVGEPPRCVSVDSGAVQVGTPGQDELRDVVVTPSGTILVAGHEGGISSSAGTIGTRGVVLAYSHDLASTERRAVLDTLGSDSFESLALAPETGTLWLAARTNGALPGLEPRGGFDLVIGELQAAGGFRPLTRGFDSTPEHPRQLAVGLNGTLAVVGEEHRLTSEDTTWVNPLLAAYTIDDASIAPRWHTTRRRPHTETYVAVDLASAGIVVGGHITDGDEQGMFIVARDLDAGLAWQRQLTSHGGDRVTSVRVLPDGDVVWAGTTSIQLGDAHHGGTDIVVGRLDGATGEPRWTVQHGSADDEAAVDLAIAAQGHLVVAGTVASPTERTDLDVQLLVLDSDGGVVMTEQWGSAGHDQPTAVAVDACGAIVLVGHTDGDLAGAPRGGRDGFVLVSRMAP